MAEITINLHDQPCGNCTICIGRTIGAKHEQERIIKLLEDPATMSNWWATPDKSLGLYGNLKNYVIALIKGEK